MLSARFHQSLEDRYGRVHDSMRISVTDRCNIRCNYCMPDTQHCFQPRAGILTFDEIETIVRRAAAAGVRKLRFTGGEPLLRKDLPTLLRRVSTIPGIAEVTLTTNGVLLGARSAEVYAAGVRRINVHLDTLDAGRYRIITCRNELDRVMASLEAARREGFSIKINAVAVKGFSEPDLAPLARYGRENGVEIRFIEFMPLDAAGLWGPEKVLGVDEMLRILGEEVCPLIPIARSDPKAPAAAYRFADGIGTIGFIGAVTKPFCGNCSRLRLTADGKLRYCLFAIEETDLRSILRRGGTSQDIDSAIRRTVESKWAGHQIQAERFVPPPRKMCAIGG
ncbi:MAG TPA: GTP 3',8-cyclase MoaA [Terriglobales bacterium]|nr:GTP 3',8-cyclase MoaA [Terriglobales bacterium]